MSDRRANLPAELAARDQQARQHQASAQMAQARATRQTAFSTFTAVRERRSHQPRPDT